MLCAIYKWKCKIDDDCDSLKYFVLETYAYIYYALVTLFLVVSPLAVLLLFSSSLGMFKAMYAS